MNLLLGMIMPLENFYVQRNEKICLKNLDLMNAFYMELIILGKQFLLTSFFKEVYP